MLVRIAYPAPPTATVIPLRPRPSQEVGEHPLDDVWLELCTDLPDERREQLLQQVILAHLELARSLARRYQSRGEDVEDLEQVACLGLTKAARGFEPGRGMAFTAYAVPTILGELKRHFRDNCWSVRPPRQLQELQTQIGAITPDLQHRLRRPPTVHELASELGVPVEEVREAMSLAGCYRAQSLEAHLEEGARLEDRMHREDPGFERVDNLLLLTRALTDTAEQDRWVLGRRFVLEWSQQRIATDLGATQMQVSRMLRRLLGRLRDRLGPDADLPLAS